MRYVLIVAGAGLVIAGLVLPSEGLNPLTATTLVSSGAAALSSGLAAYEVIAALQNRNGDVDRQRSGE
jgi:hypothetical protein